MPPIEYTHCQDYEPHEEHLIQMQMFKTIYCVGSD